MDNSPIDTQDETNGYEGMEYSTTGKTVEGYTLVSNSENTSGNMARNGTEVIRILK